MTTELQDLLEHKGLIICTTITGVFFIHQTLIRIIRKIHPSPIPAFMTRFIDRIFAIACIPEIPDHVKAMKECARILKPGGILYLCTLFPDPDYPLRSTEIGRASEAGPILEDA